MPRPPFLTKYPKCEVKAPDEGLFDFLSISHTNQGPPELEKIYSEGASQTALVDKYERNPMARQACIDHYGGQCQVCGFDFGEIYGDLGNGFIHVHHVKPLSEIGEQYQVDPVRDLRPVCPNCHAMLHRVNPPLQIDELKLRIAMFGNGKNSNAPNSAPSSMPPISTSTASPATTPSTSSPPSKPPAPLMTPAPPPP